MRHFNESQSGERESSLYRDITIGEVVDTNDPQQMGRVRVLCHGMGDDTNALLQDIPWATAMTPLGGITETTARGRDGKTSEGPVAYGMWNIPKVGSHVLIACIDGDMRFRVWLGCLHPQFMTHTMPHGRYISNGTPSVVGPLSSTESLIEPIGTHQQKSFSPDSQSRIIPGSPSPEADYTTAPEYISRGSDYSVASVRDEMVPEEASGPVSVGDDNFEDIVTEVDGNELNHANGYKESRVVTNIGFPETDGKNYDPQVYSWTTPGFHAVSMDDSANNCRIRLKTTHGNQILLDDTNERIYISTPDGNTWLEMDEKGNIDIFASRNISFHAKNDINFTAGSTFRVKAGDGIHMESDDEFRLHSQGIDGGDFHIRSETNIRQHSVMSTYIESDALIHVKSSDDIMVQTGAILNITAASSVAITTPETSISSIVKIGTTLDVGLAVKFGTTLDVGAAVTIGAALSVAAAVTTEVIIANNSSIKAPDNGHGAVAVGGGGETSAPIPPIPPIPAIPADPALEYQAYFTSRIPEHEPWARVMTKPEMTDKIIANTHESAAEFPYNSPMVNKMERGIDLSRNLNWHR